METSWANLRNSKFPNGIKCYLETYFEVVSQATREWENGTKVLDEVAARHGRMGIQDFLEGLTDEFEAQYSTKDWDSLDYYETIDEFLEEKL